MGVAVSVFVVVLMAITLQTPSETRVPTDQSSRVAVSVGNASNQSNSTNQSSGGFGSPDLRAGCPPYCTAGSSYQVTFKGAGLANSFPSGTYWNVTVNSTNGHGSANESASVKTVIFSLNDGSYSYFVPTAYLGPRTFVPDPSKGNFTVDGSALTITLHFVKYFGIAADEGGLPTGTNWTAETINYTPVWTSNAITSISSTILFLLPNGSFNFSLSNASVGMYEYVPTPSYGTVVVANSNKTWEIEYSTDIKQYEGAPSGFFGPRGGGRPHGIHPRVTPLTADGLTQQEMISWSVIGTPKFTVSFQWRKAVPNAHHEWPLPVPELGPNNTSVELNALTAGTEYRFRVTVENAYGRARVGHDFQTLPAPDNEYVGWVYDEASPENPHEILQDGSPAPNTDINITAKCQRQNNTDKWHMGDVLFSAAKSNESGGYSVTFPVESWAFYADGSEQNWFFWGGNGTCTTEGETGWKHLADSHFELTAGGLAGEWTDLESLSPGLSVSSDYKPFVLDANPLGYAAAVLALVHTPAAQCGSAFTASSSQTVTQLIGGNGHSNKTVATTTYGGGLPGWGNDSGVSIGWTVGGVLNDTSLQVANAWGQSQPSTALVPYTTTDWLNDTAFNLGSPAPPYHDVEVAPNFLKSNPEPLDSSQTVTFSSTEGTALSVSVGVNVGVVSVGVSVNLNYTTTVVHTNVSALTCELYDPSSTQTAVFYYTYNGGSLSAATVIHIWLAGYCPVGESEC